MSMKEVKHINTKALLAAVFGIAALVLALGFSLSSASAWSPPSCNDQCSTNSDCGQAWCANDNDQNAVFCSSDGRYVMTTCYSPTCKQNPYYLGGCYTCRNYASNKIIEDCGAPGVCRFGSCNYQPPACDFQEGTDMTADELRVFFAVHITKENFPSPWWCAIYKFSTKPLLDSQPDDFIWNMVDTMEGECYDVPNKGEYYNGEPVPPNPIC